MMHICNINVSRSSHVPLHLGSDSVDSVEEGPAFYCLASVN